MINANWVIDADKIELVKASAKISSVYVLWRSGDIILNL